MKCPKENCDGTLNMAYLTNRNSSTINQSFLYVCDKGPHIYLLVPKAVDPELIADGRDQVLLYLQEQLTEITHAMATTIPSFTYKGRWIFKVKVDNPDYTKANEKRDFLMGLIKERRALAHG